MYVDTKFQICSDPLLLGFTHPDPAYCLEYHVNKLKIIAKNKISIFLHVGRQYHLFALTGHTVFSVMWCLKKNLS